MYSTNNTRVMSYYPTRNWAASVSTFFTAVDVLFSWRTDNRAVSKRRQPATGPGRTWENLRSSKRVHLFLPYNCYCYTLLQNSAATTGALGSSAALPDRGRLVLRRLSDAARKVSVCGEFGQQQCHRLKAVTAVRAHRWQDRSHAVLRIHFCEG